jgi:hypothetical protein
MAYSHQSNKYANISVYLHRVEMLQKSTQLTLLQYSFVFLLSILPVSGSYVNVDFRYILCAYILVIAIHFIFIKSYYLYIYINTYCIYYYLVFVLLHMLYIPSHEYLFLFDFILYLCLSSWFRISTEIDFGSHLL